MAGYLINTQTSPFKLDYIIPRVHTIGQGCETL